MFLPLLLATMLTTAPDAGATNAVGIAAPSATPPRKVMSVRIPMPSFITPDEQLKFDIPYQIPELNWGNQRFWDPYRTAHDNTTNWFQSDYATMNWFGFRDKLATNGLDVSASYTANLAGNPVGGKSSGFTYCDNFTLDLEFQSKPLLGYDGGTLSVIALNRDGNNLSAQHIGNQFTVQQVYGGTGTIFYGLAYNQRFDDDKISFKFGRMAAGDDFASSPLYWLYMNNGIDGNPQALPVNGSFSTYPWSVWGARLRALLTKETEAMLGIYQVTPQVSQSYMHGFNWNMNPGDGVMLIGQYGWAPEFFKPSPSAAPKTSDGKSVVSVNNDGKTFSVPASDAIPHGLPGHYWMGGYYSTWTYSQFGSTQGQPGAYGLYWHFDQMLYRMDPCKDTGLTAWSAFVLSPQQNTAKVPFQYNGGLVYTGMIPARPRDISIFGVAYGNFSSNYAQANQASLGGYATYELAYEFGYRINLTKFAYVQPDAQWIINPGGTGSIPNALVLGAQIGVTF
jgi:porin